MSIRTIAPEKNWFGLGLALELGFGGGGGGGGAILLGGNCLRTDFMEPH